MSIIFSSNFSIIFAHFLITCKPRLKFKLLVRGVQGFRILTLLINTGKKINQILLTYVNFPQNVFEWTGENVDGGWGRFFILKTITTIIILANLHNHLSSCGRRRRRNFPRKLGWSWRFPRKSINVCLKRWYWLMNEHVTCTMVSKHIWTYRVKLFGCYNSFCYFLFKTDIFYSGLL